MRVAYCTNSVALGGMENHVVELATGVTRLGCDVSVIVPDVPAIAPFVSSLRAARIPVDIVSLHGAQSKQRLLGEASKLRRILRQRRIDVFHQHRTGPYHGKWACLAARIAGVRAVVATEHLPAFPLAGAARLINAAADRAVDRVVTVCELDRQRQIDCTWRSPKKVVTIHNGIDISRFDPNTAATERMIIRQELGIADRTPVLGVVARLSIEKGHSYLLQGLPSLIDEWPTLVVLVAGEGPERQRLEAEAAAYGVADHVRFLGQRSDVINILRGIDLMVLPSLKESFPIVLLEAMAMRRAAVATDTGGVSEAVIDDVTGFVVPPANAALLASAIARSLRGGRLHEMGAAGRLRVEQNFTAESMAGKARALYEELMAL
jgi:glycosyltransferase involved in cell wall biosynthesis